MDPMDSEVNNGRKSSSPHLPPFQEVSEEVSQHESVEQRVATNVSQQLLSTAFDEQKAVKESPESVTQSDTSAHAFGDQLVDQSSHQNIEYQSEQRFSGHPIHQYIYDEEEEDEEEDEDDLHVSAPAIGAHIGADEDMFASHVSHNTRGEPIDDLIQGSNDSQKITKEEILYQLSDDNVLTAQSYGIGSDLRIGSHLDHTLGDVSTEYQLNTEDPFSTPQKQKTDNRQTEESFERFVDKCEPFETIGTDFGITSKEATNSLLDFGSSDAQMTGISDAPKVSDSKLESTLESEWETNHSLSGEQFVEFAEESYGSPSGAERTHTQHMGYDSDSSSTNRNTFEPTLQPTKHTPVFTPPITSSTSATYTQPRETIESVDTIRESPIEPKVAKESRKEIESFVETPIPRQTMAKHDKSGDRTTPATTSASDANCPFGSIAEFVYWRDPKKSGVVFVAGLAILLSLTVFSIISVFAYSSLAALSLTLSFRIYKNILQAVQKTNEGHPFKEYLEVEITPSSERIHEIVDSFLSHFNRTLNKLRSVFLVEDIIDSLKFVVLFWCLTYIGAWFNGLTLIILSYLALFSLPKVYEMNKTQVDQYLSLVSTQITDITSKIRGAIPFPAKKDKDN